MALGFYACPRDADVHVKRSVACTPQSAPGIFPRAVAVGRSEVYMLCIMHGNLELNVSADQLTISMNLNEPDMGKSVRLVYRCIWARVKC